MSGQCLSLCLSDVDFWKEIEICEELMKSASLARLIMDVWIDILKVLNVGALKVRAQRTQINVKCRP